MPKDSLESVLKDLQKEQKQWRIEKTTLARQNLQLRSTNADLAGKNKVAEDALADIEGKVAEVTRQHGLKLAAVKDLTTESDNLSTQIAVQRRELADTRRELSDAKQTVDAELEQYATRRKEQVKADILAVNGELVALRSEKEALQGEIDTKTNQLAELNQAAIAEQDAIKVSVAEKDGIEAENTRRRKELEDELQGLQNKVDEVGFKYNNSMITMKKAQEAHDKFLEYEKKARKILDTKDRELQQKEAELSQEGVYLKNRRSNLAEL